MAYTKTTWQNGVTPVNADNMNKIENELETLDNNSLSKLAQAPTSSELVGIGDGNEQERILIGEGLELEGTTSPKTLKATGGGGVTSLGGATGAITLGSGLSISGNQISASGGSAKHLYYNYSFNAYNSAIGSDYYFQGLFDFPISENIFDANAFMQKMIIDQYPIWGFYKTSSDEVYSVDRIYKTGGNLNIHATKLSTGESVNQRITNMFFQASTHILMI